MYDIIFSDKALRELNKLEKKTKERILSTLERIRIRPGSYITKLVGNSGYRLKVGDYRVVMDIDWAKLLILVIKVGHRKNIYKKSY